MRVDAGRGMLVAAVGGVLTRNAAVLFSLKRCSVSRRYHAAPPHWRGTRRRCCQSRSVRTVGVYLLFYAAYAVSSREGLL